MATPVNSRKLRHRTFDRLRQKLWAVPAHLRLKIVRRNAAKRAYRPDYLR